MRCTLLASCLPIRSSACAKTIRVMPCGDTHHCAMSQLGMCRQICPRAVAQVRNDSETHDNCVACRGSSTKRTQTDAGCRADATALEAHS
jgi:hypothetical protein